jgi:hypothetical protein
MTMKLIKLILKALGCEVTAQSNDRDQYQEWLEAAYPQTLTQQQCDELNAESWR